MNLILKSWKRQRAVAQVLRPKKSTMDAAKQQFLGLVLTILTVPAEEKFGSETEVVERCICDLSSHRPKLCLDATKERNIMTAFSRLFFFSFSVPFPPSGDFSHFFDAGCGV